MTESRYKLVGRHNKPDLKNRPARLRYRQVNNVNKVKQWSWSVIGLDGAPTAPLYNRTGTLKAIREKIPKSTGLLQWHLDNLTIFYGQHPVIYAWTLTIIQPYSDLRQITTPEPSTQRTLWDAGMKDKSPTEAICDYGWAKFNYNLLTEKFYECETAHLLLDTRTPHKRLHQPPH